MPKPTNPNRLASDLALAETRVMRTLSALARHRQLRGKPVMRTIMALASDLAAVTEELSAQNLLNPPEQSEEELPFETTKKERKRA